MATFHSKTVVDSLIQGNGRQVEDQGDAPDNPWAERIVAYTNPGGHRVWGVTFEGDPDPYRYEALPDAEVVWVRPDYGDDYDPWA